MTSSVTPSSSPSHRFKVGDRVRLKPRSAWAHALVGITGRIIKDDESDYLPFLVELDPDQVGVGLYWASSRDLELLSEADPVVVPSQPRRFKVGDRVRAIYDLDKRSANGVITEHDGSCYRPFKVVFDAPIPELGYIWLWCNADEMTLIAPSPAAPVATPAVVEKAVASLPRKEWIIIVIQDGKLAPATNPRRYTSRFRADNASRVMAEKHPGKTFVVFEAVASSVLPEQRATTTHL